MKILVTGHEGFIGSHVSEHLKSLGYEVEGLSFPDDIENFKGNFKGGNYGLIIHLAAFANIRGSLDNPDVFWENNVEKSKPLFEWCRQTNTRILYASSSSVHEWWINPYAITKKVNEIQAPPNSVGMRFFNVWAEQGSRDDMLYRMLQDNTAKYLTRHRRDWIHVHDIARAICFLMPDKFRGVLDVGTGRNVSVLELAEKMGMGHLPIKEDTPGERDETCADITELTKLGWHPTINILDFASP